MRNYTTLILIFLFFFSANYVYGEQPSLKSLVQSSAVVIGKVEKKSEYQTVDVSGVKIYEAFTTFNVEKYLRAPVNKKFAGKSSVIIFAEGQDDTRDPGFNEGERLLVFIKEFNNPPQEYSQDVVYILNNRFGSRFQIHENDVLRDHWGVFKDTKKRSIPLEEAISQIEKLLN